MFAPALTLRALYAANLRVAIEVKRVSILYPQYTTGTKTAEVSWNPERLSRYSRRLRAAHLAYRVLEGVLKRLAGIHVALVTAGVLRVKTLWIQVPGTKGFRDARRSSHLFNAGR